MRDFKVLRQREITRRFRRIVTRQAPLRIHLDIDELDLLLDLDPGFAYRAIGAVRG